MKKIFKIVSVVIALTACSRYPVNTFQPFSSAGFSGELKFEYMAWEATDDSVIVIIELPETFIAAQIKEVVVNRNGLEEPAGYLNWGRSGTYKYEITNGRITLFWRVQNELNPYADRVTVIVRVKR
jgi:hypothetical protein